jgi:hypoxanthine phosphoribosyltransferase
MAKRYLSYDDMHDMLNVMYRQMALNEYKPDIVVGLVRGGMIPAVHVSHYYDVPMVAFKYSLRDHPGTDPIEKLLEVLRNGKNVLIVDDICDEGHTLHDIHEAIKAAIPFAPSINLEKLKTAVLQHNLGSTRFSPDFCGEEIDKIEKPEWIVYPWEYE